MRDELLTNDQVAEMLGVKYSTLYTYRRRNTLPQPDSYIGRTPVWKRTTIEDWKKNRNLESIEVIENT